ncbi:putative ribonuclease H protein [Sesbania bispinosa]|nr:putative ribonuclease H protein [Sesbania bispinosa]
MSQVTILKEVLDEFCNTSGLKINAAKSRIMCSPCVDSDVKVIVYEIVEI